MSAANHTVATTAALEVVRAKLAVLQWTPPGGGAAVAAFGSVSVFDMTDLVQALRELLAFKDRVALVIHAGETWEHVIDGQELRSHLTREVQLLLSDRAWAKRQDALLGTATTPGALALKDLVVPALHGILIAGTDTASAIYGQPQAGELIELQDRARKDLAGRIVYRQPVELIGGMLVSKLGKRPIT
jgi:hypothetical protein